MYQKMLLSDKVMETIETAIKNGFYKPGDRMPNEIELSEELGVSRATLREAMKILISRNVLEVRRGVGTFISQTPGFSLEAMGLPYLDLQAQVNEIKRMTRQLDLDELNVYPHLSYEMQNHINQILSMANRTPFALCQALFESLETVAICRQSTLKHRMMRVMHDAYLRVLTLHQTGVEPKLVEAYDKLCASLGDKNASVYYDDFFLRLINMTEE